MRFTQMYGYCDYEVEVSALPLVDAEVAVATDYLLSRVPGLTRNQITTTRQYRATIDGILVRTIDLSAYLYIAESNKLHTLNLTIGVFAAGGIQWTWPDTIRQEVDIFLERIKLHETGVVAFRVR